MQDLTARSLCETAVNARSVRLEQCDDTLLPTHSADDLAQTRGTREPFLRTITEDNVGDIKVKFMSALAHVVDTERNECSV